MGPVSEAESGAKPTSLKWARWMVGVCFGTAVLAQGKVMIVDSPSTIDRVKSNPKFFHKDVDQPDRGSILTADGQPLAQDDQRYRLILEGKKVPQTPAFFQAIGTVLALSPAWLEARARSGQNLELEVHLSRRQAREYRRIKRLYRADGISVSPSGKRSYPLGEAAASLVGMDRGNLVMEEKGKSVTKHIITGLEKTFEKDLAGIAGKTEGMVDIKGRMLPLHSEVVVQRKDGDNVVLTIDSEIQREAYQALRDQVVANGANSGSAVVIEPQTGNILAIANYPSYNPQNFSRGATDYNPAFQSRLEPGSIFKVLTLAKAADEGLDLHSRVQCSGEATFGKRPLRCHLHNGTRAHGSVDAQLALAKSCNIAAAKWATQIGHKKFTDWLDQTGIFDVPGVEYPNEKPGQWNRTETATALQLSRMGIGQSVSITPVGFASAISMIANGGVRMKPRLVLQKGGKDVPVQPGTRLIKEETAAEVMECMRAVIETEQGTGKRLRLPGYVLAGKTGTAERASKKAGYTDGVNTNFIGFVPGDKPRAVIVVMIEKPTGAVRTGGGVAGPAFQRIAQKVIDHYDIPPDPDLIRRSLASRSAP